MLNNERFLAHCLHFSKIMPTFAPSYQPCVERETGAIFIAPCFLYTLRTHSAASACANCAQSDRPRYQITVAFSQHYQILLVVRTPYSTYCHRIVSISTILQMTTLVAVYVYNVLVFISICKGTNFPAHIGRLLRKNAYFFVCKYTKPSPLYKGTNKFQ